MNIAPEWPGFRRVVGSADRAFNQPMNGRDVIIQAMFERAVGEADHPTKNGFYPHIQGGLYSLPAIGKIQ